MVALMSAPSTDAEPNEDGARLRYAFRQHIPIPSYLIALAVGALESRDIGPRSKVWSEASMVVSALIVPSCALASFTHTPHSHTRYAVHVYCRRPVRTSLPTLKSFSRLAKSWSAITCGVNTTFCSCHLRFLVRCHFSFFRIIFVWAWLPFDMQQYVL